MRLLATGASGAEETWLLVEFAPPDVPEDIVAFLVGAGEIGVIIAPLKLIIEVMLATEFDVEKYAASSPELLRPRDV